MKKIYLVISLLMGVSMVKAQDMDDIRKYIILKQYAKSREELDKYLNNPSNAAKPDGWYYKAFVYSVLARDAAQPMTQSNMLNQEAFKAIKKYRELDPKEKLTKEEENATLFNIYYSFYDLGVKTYNSKNYDQSFTNFSNTLEVHDYIFGNSLVGGKTTRFSSLDTDVVFNLIVLANELKKTDELVPLYKKMVDANLTDEKYLEAYEGIVMHYKKIKDQASFDEYLAKGKKNFPKDEFWEAIDIEYATDGLAKEDLFKKYDELIARYPGSYVLFYNYAFELNKYVYSDDPKTGDLSALKLKIADLFTKAIAIKSTVDANMLLANFYYNNSYDLTEEAKKIKGTKPDEVKKKQDLNNASKVNLNLSIVPAEEAVRLFAAMPKLKGSDKVNYKQALDILSTVYKINGNAKKSEEYDKKKLEVDKL